MPSSIPNFTKLNDHKLMGFRYGGLSPLPEWLPVSKPSLAPELPTSTPPTPEETKEYREWRKEADAASGLITLM
ncbi:hypothetical protein H0H93_001762, partial [Arthromyces matolae]